MLDSPEGVCAGQVGFENGAHGQMRPDQDTVQRLKARGVTVESLSTGQAARRSGEVEPARTAAALRLTC